MRLGLPFVPIKSAIALAFVTYFGSYYFLSERSTEFVGSGKSEICHYRTFQRNWQAELFRPAASLEYQLIRVLPNQVEEKQVETLQLEGPTISHYYRR